MTVAKPEDVGPWLAKLRSDAEATIVVLHAERTKLPDNVIQQWTIGEADGDDIEIAAGENLRERKLAKRQMFVCAYKEAGQKPCAKLNVAYEIDASDLVAGTEPSHAQLYRAAVDGSNRMLDAVLKTTAMTQSLCEQLATRMVAGDQAHAEVLVQLTEISSLRLEREAQAAEAKRKTEQIAELGRQIAPVVMTVIAKWTKAKTGAVPLVTLFKSIRQEQLGAIMNTLDVEQQLLFSTLLDEALKAEEDSKPKEKK
jgi:hypothetical protein